MICVPSVQTESVVIAIGAHCRRNGRQVCLFVESYRLVCYSQRMVVKSVSQDRRPARERLLAAADQLFYEEGFNLVGIDRVIERAGVAKASLYDCFGSKEELIRSYLQER